MTLYRKILQVRWGMMCSREWGPWEASQALSEALKVNSNLRQLDLRESNIGDEGGKAWFVRLKMGWSSSSYIESESPKALAQGDGGCRFTWGPCVQGGSPPKLDATVVWCRLF